jgi:hypothetical protein
MLKPVTTVLKDKQWQNQPCFIIGGGPSLKRFDFSLIDGRNSIGVNMSFRYNPTIAFVGDQDLMRRLESDPESGWRDCKSIKLARKALESWHGSTQTTRRKLELIDCYGIDVSPWQATWPRGLEDPMILVNNNGLVALQLADVLGADPIYLLGFDMRADEAGDSNWHEYYRSFKGETGDSGFFSFLETWRLNVPDRVRKKTVNVCPSSRLELFQKISFGALKAQLESRVFVGPPPLTSGKLQVRIKHAGWAEPRAIDDIETELVEDP